CAVDLACKAGRHFPVLRRSRRERRQPRPRRTAGCRRRGGAYEQLLGIIFADFTSSRRAASPSLGPFAFGSAAAAPRLVDPAAPAALAPAGAVAAGALAEIARPVS